MSPSGIKSKPVYEPLRADTGGRYHLLLGATPGGVALHRVVGELRSADPASPGRTRAWYADAAGGARASAGGASAGAGTEAGPGAAGDANAAAGAGASAAADDLLPALRSMGLAEVRAFAGPAELIGELRGLLAASSMGARLYLAGPESFIGRALQIALEFGLNKDEIRAEQLGSLARRVHCVHCRTLAEDVSTNIVRCGGCGRWLLVRDHYSRRLAAYMGVMVDAEVPGERPPVSAVFA